MLASIMHTSKMVRRNIHVKAVKARALKTCHGSEEIL